MITVQKKDEKQTYRGEWSTAIVTKSKAVAAAETKRLQALGWTVRVI